MLGLSNNIVLLTFLYFIQGLPYGFQARFLPILLRKQGVSLTNLGLFKLLLAPWLCKALWAPMVDKYGTKRKWLLGSILGLVVTCVFGCFVQPHQLLPLCVVLFLLNFFAATQDIAVDGLAVAILSAQELGQGNTAQVVGYKIGSIFGGGVLLWSLDWIGWTGMFLILAALYVEACMFVFVSPSLRHLEQNLRVSAEMEEEPVCDGQFEDAEEDDLDEVFVKIIPHGSPISLKQRTSVGVDSNVTRQSSEEDNASNCQSTPPASDTSYPTPQDQVLPAFLRGWKFAEQFSYIWEVMAVPGTLWMMFYVLIYKLGEQGALGMLPLFLIDQQVAAQEVSFWTGLVGQGTSILGSVLGGIIITKYRIPLHLLLQQFCLLRLLPLGAYIMLVSIWRWQMVPDHLMFGLAVILINISLLLSGMITTATFTFMMQCSRLAPPSIQATHYTILSTLEVFGKLMFMAVVGWLVDMFGYPVMYVNFAVLAYVVIHCLFRCPEELVPERKEVDTIGDADEEKCKME